MSRTKIYTIMESKTIDLPLGSNALDLFSNGVFFGNLTNKFYNPEKQVLDVVSESQAWLMDYPDIENQLLQNGSFLLDDILEENLSNTNLNVIEMIDESSLGSPSTTSSAEPCYDLDDLLLNLSASPEDVFADPIELSPIPLVKHVFDVTAAAVSESELNFDISFSNDGTKYSLSSPAESDDSGFNSSDDSIDAADFLSQLLAGACEYNANDVPVCHPQSLSTIDENALAFNSCATQKDVNSRVSEEAEESVTYFRPAPYRKKEKTLEQKLRKKAQNRTAAMRYRSKKGGEIEQMLKEADALEARNKDLHGKIDSLSGEISYLKNLMLDVIKARLSNGGCLPEGITVASLLTN